MQWQSELVSERAINEAQLVELHHRKIVLEIERCVTVDLNTSRA
jgi:hypothetical protein